MRKQCIIYNTHPKHVHQCIMFRPECINVAYNYNFIMHLLISSTLPIAEPRVAYECSSVDRPFHYQLLQYSEQDQYTLPCVIKPGRLRSRYEIVWVAAEPDSNAFTKHNTINLESFDLTLNSNSLPQNEKFLSCDVKIRHDSTTQNERSYCGYRIRTAGILVISPELQVY